MFLRVKEEICFSYCNGNGVYRISAHRSSCNKPVIFRIFVTSLRVKGKPSLSAVTGRMYTDLIQTLPVTTRLLCLGFL